MGNPSETDPEIIANGISKIHDLLYLGKSKRRRLPLYGPHSDLTKRREQWEKIVDIVQSTQLELSLMANPSEAVGSAASEALGPRGAGS